MVKTIGIVGIGKLGFCIAQAFNFRGFDVIAYDVNSAVMTNNPRPFIEQGPPGYTTLNEYLPHSTVRYGSLQEVTEQSDIVFIIVQTPHAERSDGSYPLTEEQIIDFDYTFLEQVIKNLNGTVNRPLPIVIVSTVMPGTIRNLVLPIASPLLKIIYSPAFPAMTSCIPDFLDQEIYICGQHDLDAEKLVTECYKQLNPDAIILPMSIEDGELTKISYNLWISLKIEFSNILAEICHKTPHANVTNVTEALKKCTTRLVSSRYMNAGLPDAGPCHSRDVISASAFTKQHNLSTDLFTWLMQSREKRCNWLTQVLEYANLDRLPYLFLGYAFKPNCNITQGSSALLSYRIMQQRNPGAVYILWDPYVDTTPMPDFTKPHAVFLGVQHGLFAQFDFTPKSVILDPFNFFISRKDEFYSKEIKYISIGVLN